MEITPQILRPLVFDVLADIAKNPGSDGSQVASIVEGVKHRIAERHGAESLQFQDYRIIDQVQMVLWQLLPQGILVWGLGGSMSRNDAYPFFRLTDHGKKVVADKAGEPQPYDPDGFLREFSRLVPEADPVALDYLTEAIRAFNSACHKSAAVMLGAASEKLILLLCDAFESEIADPAERKKWETETMNGVSISRKFNALKRRLDLMVGAKKIADHELRDTIQHALPTVSEFLRRCRNDAGHPNIPTQTDPDTVFLNLRVFTEYARRIYGLIEYFRANPAEW